MISVCPSHTLLIALCLSFCTLALPALTHTSNTSKLDTLSPTGTYLCRVDPTLLKKELGLRARDAVEAALQGEDLAVCRALKNRARSLADSIIAAVQQVPADSTATAWERKLCVVFGALVQALVQAPMSSYMVGLWRRGMTGMKPLSNGASLAVECFMQLLDQQVRCRLVLGVVLCWLFVLLRGSHVRGSNAAGSWVIGQCAPTTTLLAYFSPFSYNTTPLRKHQQEQAVYKQLGLQRLTTVADDAVLELMQKLPHVMLLDAVTAAGADTYWPQTQSMLSAMTHNPSNSSAARRVQETLLSAPLTHPLAPPAAAMFRGQAKWVPAAMSLLQQIDPQVGG